MFLFLFLLCSLVSEKHALPLGHTPTAFQLLPSCPCYLTSSWGVWSCLHWPKDDLYDPLDSNILIPWCLKEVCSCTLQPAFTCHKELLFTLVCFLECLLFWFFPSGNPYGFQSLQILAVHSVLYFSRSNYIHLCFLSGYFYSTMQGDYHWDDNVSVKKITLRIHIWILEVPCCSFDMYLVLCFSYGLYPYLCAGYRDVWTHFNF